MQRIYLYMKKTLSFKNISLSVLILTGVLVSGCVPLDDPYYNPPQRGGYYDRSYDNDYYERERTRRERHDIERERDRLDREREHLERERERRERESSRHSYEPPRQVERCPSGFSPSENKCSVEERRRGCKDMRLPGGLGCVRR